MQAQDRALQSGIFIKSIRFKGDHEFHKLGCRPAGKKSNTKPQETQGANISNSFAPEHTLVVQHNAVCSQCAEADLEI